MPRSFMITNRRYRTVVEYDSRDCSPEVSSDHRLSTAMSPQSPINTPGSGCDFYNHFHRLSSLEQLAEISLATAHRWNPSPPSSPETTSSSYSDSSLSSTSGHTSERLHFHHRHRFTHYRPSASPPLAPDDLVDQPLSLVSKHKSCHSDEESLAEVDKRKKSGECKGMTLGSNMCPECGKRYSTSSNLARHRQTHRSMEDKKARKCPHCDKVYVSMPAYSMHVRTHNQGCQCPFCGKCYSRPWLLQGHIRTHTGEKPFKCQVCNKAFADKSNLRAHVQTHSDTKPFVCQRCGKAFALKSYLYKHEESSCMRAHSTSGSSGNSVTHRSITSDKRYD